MTRILTLLGVGVTAIVTTVAPAAGQSITSPTPGQVFRAGPDYASDVLHDPWDFSNVDDVGPYPYEYQGWTQSANAFLVGPSAFGVGTGKFIATNASNDPGIGLLYAGGLSVVNTGRHGQRYPVQTSLYRKLAFRLKASGTPGSQAAVHWYSNGVGGPIAPGTALTPGLVSNGERIYQIDLVANHASGPSYTSQPNMLGLRLDPINEISQAAIELDWVRLTAPDTHPDAAMMTVSTQGCSGRTVDVLDGVTTTRVQTDGQNRFNYGIFPPGNYQLIVSCNGTPLAPVPFTINDPPRITVLQPDEGGSADYATTLWNNPWNFDHPADVPAFNNVEFLADTTVGRLHARNAGPSLGDTQLFFLNGEGSARPIATTRYRYLTFTLGLNHPFSLTGTDGSVARVLWGSDPVGFDGNRSTTTADILVFPGFRSYTVDLAALSVAGGTLVPCPSCIPWTARSARFFRFDPLEFGTKQVDFLLGTVTLTAPDEVVQGGTFPIQWSVAQAGGGSTATIFIDTNADGVGLTQIGTAAASAGVFNWQANVAPGDYFVYVQIAEPGASNGTDTRGAYSTGVLRVIAAANSPVVSIATHASGDSAFPPFTIAGCAFNAATGGAADEVFVYAHPLQGQLGGQAVLLGYNAAGGTGTASTASCGAGPGYQITNIFGLPSGLWTFRTIARNAITGDFDEVQVKNISIGQTAAPPRNFRASVSGNTVSLAWDAPAQGVVTQYRIEAAADSSFAGFSWAVLPPTQTSITATLPNGTFYLRIRAGNTYSNDGPPSNVINFTLPGGGPVAPPGSITLGGQVTTNPVSLNWSQTGGGAATYVLHAGTAPGASNLAVVPMGVTTSLPPVVVPVGVSIYVRIVASNAAGSTVSNEVVINVPAPGPPGGSPIQLDPVVSGNTVTLRWNPPPGGVAPTGYVLVGRLPGSPTVIAVAPVAGTSLTVPGVPSGTYIVTVVAIYGSTPSGESNPKTLSVP